MKDDKKDEKLVGLSLKDTAWSSDIWRKFRAELSVLHIKGGQLQWFGHLFRTPLPQGKI